MDVLQLFQWNETRAAVEKLHLLLKCRVCDELPKDPVVLPECHHTFCAACLRERPSCSSSDPRQCPQCGTIASHLPPSTHPDHLTMQLCDALQDLQSLLTSDNQKSEGISDAAREVHATRNSTKAPVSAAGSVEVPLAPESQKSKPTITRPQLKSGVIQLKSATPQSSLPTTQAKQAVPQSKSVLSHLNPPNTQPKPASPRAKPVTTQSNPATSQSAKPTTPQAKPVLHRLTPKRETSSFQNLPRTPEVARAGTKSVPETPKLDRRNLKGETVLHAACVKGDEQLVRRLLQEGANPNCRDHAGWTPLHEACQHGHVAIAEALLRAGALPSVPGYEGNATPLHDAVEHGRDEVIRTLRRYGARDDIRNMYGHTARDLASLCRAPEALLAALDTLPDPDLLQQVRHATPPLHSIVVTGSNLTPDQAKLLQSFGKLFKIRVFSEYCPEVSHVVVSCEEKRLVCLRTAKFMMAVVAGKWIVSHAWVQACVQQKSLVSAEDFEVSGSSQNAASSAPTLARLNADNMLPGLFSGCHIYLHGQFKSNNCPSKRDLEGLVRAGGGRLLLREPKPEGIPAHEKTVPYHASLDSCLSSCSHYIIYLEGSDSEPKLKYDMAHIKSLPLSWLIDCVDHFKLLPPFHSVE